MSLCFISYADDVINLTVRPLVAYTVSYYPKRERELSNYITRYIYRYTLVYIREERTTSIAISITSQN